MISYEIMETKINETSATIIRQYKPNSIKHKLIVKLVQLNNVIYKLCPQCMYYQILDSFTYRTKEQRYELECKGCRAKKSSYLYATDLEYYKRIRLNAINQRIRNIEDECTKEEFEHIFYNLKDEYTGKTLYEDWMNPDPNPNLQLDIDHIIAFAKGGNSKPENLRVVPRVINAIKSDCTPEEFHQTLEFLFMISKSTKSHPVK